MKSKILNIVLVMALAGLSGCASMSADECLAVDWATIGFEDGSRGYTADRVGNHRKACAKHGVTADLAAYQRGHAQGLETFCQPGRGFNFGVNGGGYNGVCPAHLEQDFLEAYSAGHKLYSLRSSLNQANSLINSKETEIDNAEKRIVTAQLEMIADETTSEQRVLLLVELKDLAERIGELEVEIEQLIVDRARIGDELQYYESTLTAYGY